MKEYLVSVDIGGTFTDLFAIDRRTGSTLSAKALTSSPDLSVGVFNCIEQAGLTASAIHTLVHGSTVVINTVIERSGARTALVVTRGTRDVYSIGRNNRPESYNIFFKKAVPFVPRHLSFEVDERRSATGEELVPFDASQAASVAERIAGLGVDAVAVCFLHSYAYPENEIRMGEILRETLPDAFTTLSHEVVREYREYERTSTTVVNAYCGPRLREYVGALEARLAEQGFEGSFLVMQSNGGVMAPPSAKRLPVAQMESGPVGGVIASAHIGSELGYQHVISFDMGGTTAKMSVISDAAPTMTHGYYVGGYAGGHPVMMPVVDIVEVGAGGGSVAWLDGAGALRVGPRSAGAAPGPICYGFGGSEPTLTDANVVLGRLSPDNFLGGTMRLDVNAARFGIDKALGSLEMSTNNLAAGIVQLAVNSMVLAVRSVSVERGYDPRDFCLVAQGGNGPLHALQVARELGIPEVIVPPLPGVFSAVGMLIADLRHDFVRTFYTRVDTADFTELKKIVDELSEEGLSRLQEEGVEERSIEFERSLEVRYVGQEFVLPVPVSEDDIEQGDRLALRKAFDTAHEHRFGHAATAGESEPVEIVNVRVAAIGRRDKPVIVQALGSGGPKARTGSREVWLDAALPVMCPVFARHLLGRSEEVVGPALIEEHDSTTLLWPGDVARVSESGALLIKVAAQ